ncbi:MAG: RNA methyltransferase [Chlorobi bacterium]|nr:RNA methyltransferase [Chlorobiota bacterium]
MLTRREIAYINKLQRNAKFRHNERKFVVETPKIVTALLHSDVKIERIYATETWLKVANLPKDVTIKVVSEKELHKISSLTNPNQVVGIAQIPEAKLPDSLPSNWYVYLDSIRDPGNMGTIIRLCHWFNISILFGTPDCVDVYNPKVVQASMGSIGFVRFIPIELSELLKTFPDFQAYCLSASGNPIKESSLPGHGFLIAGNESRGISPKTASNCHSSVSIPRFNQHIDSLNVATAIAMALYHVKLCL